MSSALYMLETTVSVLCVVKSKSACWPRCDLLCICPKLPCSSSSIVIVCLGVIRIPRLLSMLISRPLYILALRTLLRALLLHCCYVVALGADQSSLFIDVRMRVHSAFHSIAAETTHNMLTACVSPVRRSLRASACQERAATGSPVPEKVVDTFFWSCSKRHKRRVSSHFETVLTPGGLPRDCPLESNGKAGR